MSERKYPVGIQTFSNLISGGYVYIDKTDLVWQLQNYAKYVFLGRPRRFGKSLLTSTLESYFRGDRALFEGLKIMSLEHDWLRYPVIHLDLSVAKGKPSAHELQRSLVLMLSRQEGYAGNPMEVTPGEILEGIIRQLYRQTGMPVVVIVDEYDAPLLDMLHDEPVLQQMRMVMQEFYQPLKACESMLKFCFITGITKFSQLSIFSTINNLTNVTMDPKFATICGITERELSDVLGADVEQLASANQETPQQMRQWLKQYYDGYHFSENSDGVYNPYSLLKALQSKKIDNYWFESGTPLFLVRQMQRFHTDITSLDKIEVMSTAFDLPTEAMDDALPLLYQTGYLTIKDYERESGIYTLSFPNAEVQTGYARGLIPVYLGLKLSDTQGFAIRFWRALKSGDVDLAMREMQAYLSGLPYVEGFKQKLEDLATAEGFYEYTFYLIFTSFNDLVRTQVKCAQGRTDVVVFMPDAVYVMELKVNKTAQAALEQINSKGYALPYTADGRRVVKIGINFSTATRSIDEWLIAEA